RRFEHEDRMRELDVLRLTFHAVAREGDRADVEIARRAFDAPIVVNRQAHARDVKAADLRARDRAAIDTHIVRRHVGHTIAPCGRDVARAHAVYARVLAVRDRAGRDAGDRSVEIIFVLPVETQTVCLYAANARRAVRECAGSRAARARAQLAVA